MTKIIELHDFALLGLHVEFPQFDSPRGKCIEPLWIDFHPMEVPEETNTHKLRMRVCVAPTYRNRRPESPRVEIEVGGRFLIPESDSDSTRNYLLLYNGGMILYGIMRGQLASMTGALPGGKFLLPTIDMKAYLEKWSRRIAVPASKQKKATTKSPRARDKSE